MNGRGCFSWIGALLLVNRSGCVSWIGALLLVNRSVIVLIGAGAVPG